MFVLKPYNSKRLQNVLEDSLDSWYSRKLIIKTLRSRNGSSIKGRVVWLFSFFLYCVLRPSSYVVLLPCRLNFWLSLTKALWKHDVWTGPKFRRESDLKCITGLDNARQRLSLGVNGSRSGKSGLKRWHNGVKSIFYATFCVETFATLR